MSEKREMRMEQGMNFYSYLLQSKSTNQGK